MFRAGLNRGDVIIQVNGNNVTENSDILKLLDKNNELLLVVRRGTNSFSTKLNAIDFKN